MIIVLETNPAVHRTMTFARLNVNDVNRAASVAQTAGGDGIDAARSLHARGERCIVSGLVGGDEGMFVRRELDREGIAHDFIDISPVATPMRLTVRDESSGTATEVITDHSPPPDAFDALLAKLDQLIANTRASRLIISGGDDAFRARCIELARRRNVPAGE